MNMLSAIISGEFTKVRTVQPRFEPMTQQFETVILANKFESEYLFRVQYGHMKSTWHYSHDVSIFSFILRNGAKLITFNTEPQDLFKGIRV